MEMPLDHSKGNTGRKYLEHLARVVDKGPRGKAMHWKKMGHIRYVSMSSEATISLVDAM